MNTNVIEIVKKRMSKKPLPVVDTHAEITKIAKRIYEQSGYRDGCALDHWLEAETIYNMQLTTKKTKLTLK